MSYSNYSATAQQYFRHVTLRLWSPVPASLAAPHTDTKRTCIIKSSDLLWRKCLMEETHKSNLPPQTSGCSPDGVLHTSRYAFNVGVKRYRSTQWQRKVVRHLIYECRQQTAVHHATRKESCPITWLAIHGGTAGAAMPLDHRTNCTDCKRLQQNNVSR